MISDGGWLAAADRMPEGEVALRLAEYLSEHTHFGGHVEVAIDGASVAVGGAVIFDVAAFMRANGWVLKEPNVKSRNPWSALYRRGNVSLRIHSRSGVGDVEAVIGGRRVVAECKKGPLITKPGSPERPLLTAALGQALLIPAEDSDLIIAAVPDTPAFQRIAQEWRQRPRVRQSAIQIAMVNRDGRVSGLTF